MAMSSAPVPAPTHSSSWGTTCTSTNGKSTTLSRGRGGSLHPVIQAGRTADLSAAPVRRATPPANHVPDVAGQAGPHLHAAWSWSTGDRSLRREAQLRHRRPGREDRWKALSDGHEGFASSGPETGRATQIADSVGDLGLRAVKSPTGG